MPRGERPARQRSFHRRSRNGCENCKKRHLRCDERSPFCRNCLSRGSFCSFSVPLQEPRDKSHRNSLTTQASKSDDNMVDCESLENFDFEVDPRQEWGVLFPKPSSLPQKDADWSVPSDPPSSCSSVVLASEATTGSHAHSFNIQWDFNSERPERNDEAIAGFGSLMEKSSFELLTLHQKQAMRFEEAERVCKLPELCDSPLCPTIKYISPLDSDLDIAAVAHMHHFRNMLEEVPIPQYCRAGATELYKKIYQIGSRHDFVKHALIGMSSKAYFDATESARAREVAQNYLVITLRELQEAIESFSPENADAIIAASISLIYGAQNWHQWTVYVAGYSAVFRRLRGSKPDTVFSFLSSPNFWLKLSEGDRTEHEILPAWSVRSSSKERAQSVTTSLVRLRPKISDEDWTDFGFKELEFLAMGLQDIDRLETVEEVYVHLTPLRMWMFCVELDEAKHQPLWNVVRVYFYVLLMAMTPYMSPSCCGKFSRECKFMVRKIQLEGCWELNSEVREVFELLCEENCFMQFTWQMK